ATAVLYGLGDPFDPAQALPASARLLSELVDRFGNLGLAAAAYNAGPRRVVDWLANRGSLPRETRNYVQIITGEAPEQWRSGRGRVAGFRMPARLPCRRITDFMVAVDEAGEPLSVAI